MLHRLTLASASWKVKMIAGPLQKSDFFVFCKENGKCVQPFIKTRENINGNTAYKTKTGVVQF